jgi:hypothetical protein
VRGGEESRLSLPLRRGLPVRRSLQVPRLHLLHVQGLLCCLPGWRLQV